jgi:hydrogenase expression/formation protein HypC
MCLGIPAKIVELYQKEGTRMGKVDFGGVLREVCFETLPEAQVGEYAIIHVGFAISSMDEQDAMETLELLREIDEAGAEMEANQ